MLVQLPNGNWIDPKAVTSVRSTRLEEQAVVVLMCGADRQIFDCSSKEHAEQFRDNIVSLLQGLPERPKEEGK